MKRIDLIPPEARKLSAKSRAEKYLLKSPVLRLAVLGVLTLFLIFIYQTSISIRYKIKISSQKKNLEKLETELARRNDEQSLIKKKIDAIEEENKYLAKRLSFLEKSRLEAVKWSEVLLRLGKLAPSDLWIKKIYLNKERITINGAALNNSLVSDFMVKLDESRNFKDTSFNFTHKKRDTDKKLGEFPVIDFEIITQLAK